MHIFTFYILLHFFFVVLYDARLKSMFEEELREREELLELHLDMPGLFREVVSISFLIFTCQLRPSEFICRHLFVIGFYRS